MNKETKIQLTIWVSVIITPILLILFFTTKDMGLVTSLVAAMLIYFGYVWSPRFLMFIIYHLVVGGLVWFFCDRYWLPLLSNLWDGLDRFMQAVTYTGLATLSVWSVFSCFDDKTLKETELGHWSISNWLPKNSWAANLKNGPFGVFTGLPSFLVSIKKVDGNKFSVKRKFVIQVEIYDDPLDRKFVAVFDTSFNYQVVDTLKTIFTPSKQPDLEVIFEKALTDWLNDSSHNYTNVKGVKAEIQDIQTRVIESLGDAEEIYGKEMSDPRVIDVQLPDEIIAQQIQEAREVTNLDGYIDQLERLRAKLTTMKEEDVVEQLNLILGLTKKTTINNKGKGGGVIPVVTT